MSIRDKLREELEKAGKPFNNFEELVALLPEELQDRMEKLKSNPERTDYHPEGNTYDHIKIVTERLMTTGDIDLVMAGLFHDLGKLETTKPNPRTGQPSAFGHEALSGKIASQYRGFIESMGADFDMVHEIVVYHMRIKQMPKMRPAKQDAMRTLRSFNKLETFTRADSMLNEFEI